MPQNTNPEQTSFASAATTKKFQRASSSSLLQPKLRSPIPLSPTEDGGAKFPRIDECVHFHYETVDCGKVELMLLDEAPDSVRFNGTFDFEKIDTIFWISVKCKGKSWVIRRIPSQFQKLDELLHECVYDRKFTQLQPLDNVAEHCDDKQILHAILKKYISRLSELPEDQMSCAPVLHWFDMDNKGTKLVAALRETADINIPAVAAAHTVRRYTAQSADELSLEVGDMVSIIDMCDANWWRGKCKLQVGSFPALCVKRISDARHADEVHAVASSPPPPVSSSPPKFNATKTKPIVKKHGKFMDFLRSFLVTRPTKSRLKQTGILKERVFGCDLGEYLHNCEDDVPVVVKDCTEFVEKYGVVDGIYRISGVASHVQNLRHEYDCERRPDMNRDPSGKGEQSICDPHSVAGLCKLYFRELPNPLLTYQLYNRFADAIAAQDDERLLKIHDVIQQLPPPHYRTLKHLAMHLQRMSRHEDKTSMHCRNLAIVWAPNLLRSRDLEAGLAAFTEARVQSVVTEFLIANADILFSDELQHMQLSRGQKPPRPKSLMVLSGPKLISLEEAQARSRAGDGFSKPSSENFASIEDHIQLRRSSRSPSPERVVEEVGTPSSKPIAIIPLSSGGSMSMKRRQSMDPKFGSHQQQPNCFPGHSKQYSSQHSTGSAGWRSKLGSFLKKGNGAQPEDNAPKIVTRVTLRRSQSEDSMLSCHSSRHDDEIETSETKSNDDAVCDRRALRSNNSPRSPRPKGNIFVIGDDFKSISASGKPRDHTPDSIRTLSGQTNSSSQSPFSGLDSNFPGVMGESGLGFNPMQYSPTFSSDSGIPELPRSYEHRPLSPENTEKSKVNKDNTSVDTSEDVDATKQDRGPVPNPSVPSDCDASLAVKTDTRAASRGDEAAIDNVEPIETTEPCLVPLKSGQQTADDRNTNASNNQGSQSGECPETTPSKTNRSFYWKTEEIDSLDEIGKPRGDRNTPGPREILSRTKSQPVDLPPSGNYSVRYACNSDSRNGRTRGSIVATFVRDRPLDSRVRRPHSIRRSFDVPPTDLQHSSGGKLRIGDSQQQHRSIYDITRRQRAYRSWASQYQKENRVAADERWHCRSQSVGDDEISSESRTPSKLAVKPAQLPRQPRRLPTAIHGDATAVVNRDLVVPSLLKEPLVGRDGCVCASVLSEQTIAKPPQPGIVSPSDTVCASTVPRWV